MTFYEILLIILIVTFVVFIFGRAIYKKVKKLPSGECACCHSNFKRLVKKYKKKSKKNCTSKN